MSTARTRFVGAAYPPIYGIYALSLAPRPGSLQEVREAMYRAAEDLCAGNGPAPVVQQRLPKLYRSLLEAILTAKTRRDKAAGRPTLPFLSLPELQGLCVNYAGLARCTTTDFDGALQVAEAMGLCTTWVPQPRQSVVAGASAGGPKPLDGMGQAFSGEKATANPSTPSTGSLLAHSPALTAATAAAAAGVPGAAATDAVVCIALPYACAVAAEVLSHPSEVNAEAKLGPSSSNPAVLNRLALEAQLEDYLEGEGPALLLLSLLQRSFLLVPLDDTRLLTPLRLPVTTPTHYPSFLRQLPARHKVVRRYFLTPYLPNAAWLVLLGRQLNQATATGVWRAARCERSRSLRPSGLLGRRLQDSARKSSALPSPGPLSGALVMPLEGQEDESARTRSASGSAPSVPGQSGASSRSAHSDEHMDQALAAVAAHMEPCSPPRDLRPVMPPEFDLGSFSAPHLSPPRVLQGGHSSNHHAPFDQVSPEESRVKGGWRPVPSRDGFQPALPMQPDFDFGSDSSAHDFGGRGTHSHSPEAALAGNPHQPSGSGNRRGSGEFVPGVSLQDSSDGKASHHLSSDGRSSLQRYPPLSPSASFDSITVKSGFQAPPSPSRPTSRPASAMGVSISNVRRASLDFTSLAVSEDPKRQLTEAVEAYVACARDTHDLSRLSADLTRAGVDICHFEAWSSGLALGLSDTCGILVQRAQEDGHHFVEMCVVVPNLDDQEKAHGAISSGSGVSSGASLSASTSIDEDGETASGALPGILRRGNVSPSQSMPAAVGREAASAQGADKSMTTASHLLGNLLSALGRSIQQSLAPFPGVVADGSLRVAPAFSRGAQGDADHATPATGSVATMTPLRDLEITLDAQDASSIGSLSRNSRLRTGSGTSLLAGKARTTTTMAAVRSASCLSELQPDAGHRDTDDSWASGAGLAVGNAPATTSLAGLMSNKRLATALRNFEVETMAPDLLPMPGQDLAMPGEPEESTSSKPGVASGSKLAPRAQGSRISTLVSLDVLGHEEREDSSQRRQTGAADQSGATNVGTRLIYQQRSALRADLAVLKGLRHPTLVNFNYSCLGARCEIRFPTGTHGTLHDVLSQALDYEVRS